MNRSRIAVNLRAVPGGGRRNATQPVQQPLHRAAAVMQQEGLSVRSVARRMHISASQVRAELNPQRDLRLSDLHRWRSALRVPVVDLLVHPGTGLSDPIQLRAKLLKMMKTVRSLQEMSANEAISCLVARLECQLTDLMPELKDVSSWPSTGKRRTLDEVGALVERSLPESFFSGNLEGNSLTGCCED